MENMIDVTGVSLIELVKIAWELSWPKPYNFDNLKETLSDDEVLKVINLNSPFPVALGTLKGRVMNLLVVGAGDGYWIPADWKDHTRLNTENLLLRLGIRYSFEHGRHQIGCGCTNCYVERQMTYQQLVS